MKIRHTFKVFTIDGDKSINPINVVRHHLSGKRWHNEYPSARDYMIYRVNDLKPYEILDDMYIYAKNIGFTRI